MKIPALLLDRRVQWIAGSAIGVSILLVLFGDQPKEVHGVNGWILLEKRDTVRLERGVRYRGCVQVPFVIPTSLVFSKVSPGLLDKGFRDVVVTRDHPSGWPDVDCDIYVEATWDRADEDLDRPGAVELAWREAPG